MCFVLHVIGNSENIILYIWWLIICFLIMMLLCLIDRCCHVTCTSVFVWFCQLPRKRIGVRFRSILRQSRPNKAGLKCASVRTSVCPFTKVSSISVKFGVYVEVDEWCTTVCSMTRSKVKVTSPSKLEISHFQKLSPLPFTMGAGNSPQILKLGHNV